MWALNAQSNQEDIWHSIFSWIGCCGYEVLRVVVSDGLPSIPDYYKKYVDKGVDLNDTPHQPCPFHGETHGKSFSFKDGIWSCFGACHVYGADVIELHRRNYKLSTREEAELSLRRLYGLPLKIIPTFERREVTVDDNQVERKAMYNKALRIATTVESWVELDYILSKVPYDVEELKMFCEQYGK